MPKVEVYWTSYVSSVYFLSLVQFNNPCLVYALYIVLNTENVLFRWNLSSFHSEQNL